MRLARWQKILIPLCVSLACAFFVGLWYSGLAAVSFLVGSSICWLGNLFFFFALDWKIKQKRSARFLLLYYIAETLKLAFYAISFMIAARYYHLQIFPMLIGFLINILMCAVLFLKALGDV